MGIFLPNYLLTKKHFECKRCGFKFFKQTPSQVEKCPQCKAVVFDRNYKKGEPLDPYSKSKLRWYSDESGQYHMDEIKRRKIRFSDGRKEVLVTDEKGRTIEALPDFDVRGSDMGKKKNIKPIK